MTAESDKGTLPVLVVGAGPTGLTMAAELARHGVHFRIIDRSPQPSEHSKALAVQPRTLEIFEDMGLIETALAQGLELTELNAYSEGRRIVHLTLSELDSPYPFILSLPQSTTENILIQHLKGLGVEVERQVEFTYLSQNNNEVTAVLHHGSGREELCRCHWLIGCDGAHSAVRHGLDLSFAGGDFDELFMLADVRIDWSEKPPAGLCLFNKGDRVIGVIPMPGDRFRIIAVLPPEARVWEGQTDEPGEPPLSAFQDLMNECCHIRATLSDPVWLSGFKVRFRKVLQYKAGRVFLAGDAAHVHSPAGGQGLNTGIQDAYNLAWKLALVVRGLGKSALIDSYHAERDGVAVALLKGTNFLTRVNIMRNPIGRQVRNRLAPLLVAQEVVQQRIKGFLSELAISYRKSPIVLEHRHSLLKTRVLPGSQPEEPNPNQWLQFSLGPSAGDRVPDASLTNLSTESHIRLFAILQGTRHCLLLLTGTDPSADVLQSLSRIAYQAEQKYDHSIHVHIVIGASSRPASLNWDGSTFLDEDLSLHHRLGAGSECLYLIRPDGYIGCRAQPADFSTIEEYFEHILIPRTS